ncbi:hypothetical protein H6G64_30105 [Calothrix sp. FACHB-156]|nr:hypothetical protein [Calothrix sp. FACHB-156]
MGNIYQEIWDADQEHNGIKAVKKGDKIDAATKAQGYVVVDEKKNALQDHKLLVEVVIPPAKEESYTRVATLFNNYTLDQTKPEINKPEEAKEVQEFIEAVYKSPPMQVARNYVSQQYLQRGVKDEELTDNEWWAILQRVWFEQFDDGMNKDLSGFEHVLVGEQKQGKVQGYHFWYKYYLDENFVFEGKMSDSIDFLGWQGNEGDETPDVVTLSYRWRAFDYEKKKFRPLTKPIGGFWVGPSAEGLMAIGTVRFLNDVFAPKKAEINKVFYNLSMFRSPNGRNLRTFYPEFVKML